MIKNWRVARHAAATLPLSLTPGSRETQQELSRSALGQFSFCLGYLLEVSNFSGLVFDRNCAAIREFSGAHSKGGEGNWQEIGLEQGPTDSNSRVHDYFSTLIDRGSRRIFAGKPLHLTSMPWFI